MINLKPKHLLEVKRILSEYVPGYEVRVFGSRITMKCKKYSDLDLVFVGDEKFDLKKIELAPGGGLFSKWHSHFACSCKYQ